MSSSNAGNVTAPAGRWWCEHCDEEIPASGARLMRSGRLRCPSCGKRLVEGVPGSSNASTAASGVALPGGGGAGAAAEEHVPAPWHFKLLAVGTVLYLIYRLIWFIFWLTGHAWQG